MSAKYTCQRCMGVLRSSKVVPRTTLRPPTSRLCSSLASRRRTATSQCSARHVSTQSHQVPAYEDEFQHPGKKASLRVKPDGTSDLSRMIVQPNDLFHPLSESPIPSMRQRANFIKSHAYCHHPSHNRSRVVTSEEDPEFRKPVHGGLEPQHVKFECPYCGIPTYCSEDHWAEDFEEHMKLCDTLRQINEDEHDLRSGRTFTEYEFPERYMEEAVPNFTNWDTFLYTRGFEAINEDRNMRHATRVLTYPMTVASVLHQFSPLTLSNHLKPEGLRSMAALRYNLHPPKVGEGGTMKTLKPQAPPIRLFVIGARAESSLPRNVWLQLAYQFPGAVFHIIMIGPESMMNRDDEYPLPERTMRNPFGAVIEDQFSREMKISTYVEYFHTLHEARHFVPYDPYFDCFVLFHPGLGHPSSSHEWERTVPQLLETKCPILVTGYTESDMARDVEWVNKTVGGEFDLLIEPHKNTFRSLKWDLNDLDPQDVSAGNWGLWAFRGKRYEAQRKDFLSE